MPRPVLSDTAFNADNVATSILQQANLQVTNENLGVTDITSSFVRQSGFSVYLNSDNVFKFNGFVFYMLSAQKTSTPSSNEVCWQIDETYRPSEVYHTNSVTYQADTLNYVEIHTDGGIKVNNPIQGSGSDSSWRVVINGWYRI